ncbi:MAG: hypothetical protein V1816_09730 [Pseudomonadota bacterium]
MRIKYSRRLRLLGLLGCFLLLTACSGPGPAAKDEFKNSPAEVQFFDSGSFDRKLSSTLAQNPPEAAVAFAAPVSLNHLPERLDKWLNKVEESGGRVELEMEPGSDETSRGVVSEALALVIGVYVLVADKIIYDPAGDYNAVVYYRGDAGTITRVVFVRRTRPGD